MGKLDKVCLLIAAYIRRYITQYDPTKDQTLDSFLAMLTQSYTHLNNFLLKDNQTQVQPAMLHLGVLKTKNLTTFYDKIAQEEVPIESKEIKHLRQLLALSRQHVEAEKNRKIRDNKEERRHLRQHGLLITDERFQQLFQPLTLVYLRVEEDQKKTGDSQRAWEMFLF